METELCKLAQKYKTDKCPQNRHGYTPEYYRILKDKRDFKKVLELGIGSYITMRHVDQYQVGASLKMWRDFFPNAQIYGVDYDPSTIFQEERITTFLYNTRSKEDMLELIEKVGSVIDLVVDDGPHNTGSQIFTARVLLPLLKKGVIYVIEDTKNPQRIKNSLPEYDLEILELGMSNDDNLVIIRK